MVVLPVAVKSLILKIPDVTPPLIVLKLKAPAMPALIALLDLPLSVLLANAAAIATPAASATMRDLSLRRARIVESPTVILPVLMLEALGSPMRASRLRVITLPVPAPTSAPEKDNPRAPDAPLAAPAMA